MIKLSERTRRGLAEAILLPGVLGAVVALLLFLEQWMGGVS